MQNALEIKTDNWRSSGETVTSSRINVFVAVVVVAILVSALLASWLPLPVSIATVFLFAGPHNWFEFRYFVMRLPLRFGRSRHFFLTAFIGLGVLSTTYVALPLIYRSTSFSNDGWLTLTATWNTLLLAWLCLLVWLRSKQKSRSQWLWFVPLTLALCAFNWAKPDFFSLALVYIHPLVALWFLDRHICRNRPTWLRSYRRCLALVPVVLGLMVWQLHQSHSLAEDNGLFWRITQHSGAELLPNVSSHLLVSVHLFLEMLHYGVWLVALPLITKLGSKSSQFRVWDVKTIPIVKHPRGFPKSVTFGLGVGVALVLMLWLGFSIDYGMTRDIYFTIAMAHVMAEAPFLLRMI